MPGTERPEDRAAEQRRILEQRVKQARDRASRARKAAKRSLDVTPQTGNPGGEVSTRTQPSRENAENAGFAGGQAAPPGDSAPPWPGVPRGSLFPAVEHPLSEEMDRELVGRNIRHAKDLTGLGHRELARRTGIERRDLRRYEQGTRMPTVPTLARIATALGYPVDWFLAEHAEEAQA